MNHVKLLGNSLTFGSLLFTTISLAHLQVISVSLAIILSCMGIIVKWQEYKFNKKNRKK